MVCNKCKQQIDFRKIRADGLPCGITFELDNGLITLCGDCLRVLGRTSKEEARKFAEELGVEQCRN